MSQAERRYAFAAAMFALLAAKGADAILHKHLSFDPPFLEVDHFGKRTVGYTWAGSGATKALVNFVRLTPDQQSKKGALWSVDAIGSTIFSAVLEFRISGKGDRFFGDGLALWVVEPERLHDLNDMHYGGYYNDDDWGGGGGWGGGLKDLKADLPSGDYHGFVDDFKGLGVIVDTYRNEEFYSSHKDITVVYNNGNMTKEEMITGSAGCNAQVRYYEKRDDFDPGSLSSRLKVEVSGSTLTVKVDAKNSKTWTDCAQIELPSLMGDAWTKGAHLGLTASTGELSDNHDVIRLETYISSTAAERGEKQREQKRPVEVEPEIPLLERVTILEGILNAILTKMESMQVHQEHYVEEVDEHVNRLLSKTGANEEGIKGTVETLELKVQELEVKMRRQFENTLEMGLSTATAAAKGWRLPFMLVLLALAVGASACYKMYRNLRKAHFF